MIRIRDVRLMPVVVTAMLAVALLTTFLWPRPEPASAAGVSAIAGGGDHTCALATSGSVKCWGQNTSGQLGDGTTTQRLTPVNVTGLASGMAAIAAGSDHSCALTQDGGVKCWGRNDAGQLGIGTAGTGANPTPVDVVGLASGVAAIAAGTSHTCALTTGGGVKCWGSNSSGQVGHGTMGGFVSTPIDVSGLTSGVAAISAGGHHTCALTTGATVKCWGDNFRGDLGDGTTDDSAIPVDVCADEPCASDLSGVTAVAAGSAHTCALMTAGNVKCWGSNNPGQLGIGAFDFDPHPTPEDVAGLATTTVEALTAGFSHTCALTAAGGAKCWGSNGSGQLGNGTTTHTNLPVNVLGLGPSVLASLAAGNFHTCALTTAASAKCWGMNTRGQVGDGTRTARSTPADVFGLGEPPDSDSDGCTDGRESGPNPVLGGLRDPKYFWDFFDTPDAANVRDQLIDTGDLFRVVLRFGATAEDDVGDPLSLPADPPAYHTAFDRSPPQPGGDAWDIGPPDGSITVNDIFFAVGQFGHSCV